MSDESSNAIINRDRDWGVEHLQAYVQSGGQRGHVMDLSRFGGFAFTPNCLIKTRGRKTGKVYLNPLICGYHNGEVVIVASKGGADSHPSWYLNLIHRKELEFQVATEAFQATWREPQGVEREKVWEHMLGVFPPYAGYQQSTARRIPVIMLLATGRVPVFSEADLAG